MSIIDTFANLVKRKALQLVQKVVQRNQLKNPIRALKRTHHLKPKKSRVCCCYVTIIEVSLNSNGTIETDSGKGKKQGGSGGPKMPELPIGTLLTSVCNFKCSW